MKAVVAASNQEKPLVGAFSVITNLRMELFEALVVTPVAACDWDDGIHQTPTLVHLRCSPPGLGQTDLFANILRDFRNYL